MREANAASPPARDYFFGFAVGFTGTSTTAGLIDLGVPGRVRL